MPTFEEAEANHEKSLRPPSIVAPGERRRIERRLQEVGVLCQPEVSLQYQTGAKRSVLRGVESGGAAKDIGRYVTFCGENGEQLPWLQPIDSVGANGRHGLVIAPLLLSVEVFRVKNTYDILVVKYAAAPTTNGRRGRIESSVMFRGRQGYLPLDLTSRGNAACEILPEFFNKAGERLEIRADLVGVLKAAIQGANCVGCTHQHYLVAPKTVVVAATPAAVHDEAVQGAAT
ncbi:MAG: hypothetical protein K2X03_02445 [Bryobacteraceae bacterium]|nr:hypothetical protein [Bryobacteraceae bacterium]